MLAIILVHYIQKQVISPVLIHNDQMVMNRFNQLLTLHHPAIQIYYTVVVRFQGLENILLDLEYWI